VELADRSSNDVVVAIEHKTAAPFGGVGPEMFNDGACRVVQNSIAEFTMMLLAHMAGRDEAIDLVEVNNGRCVNRLHNERACHQ
jgi:hypothetical protein